MHETDNSPSSCTDDSYPDVADVLRDHGVIQVDLTQVPENADDSEWLPLIEKAIAHEVSITTSADHKQYPSADLAAGDVEVETTAEQSINIAATCPNADAKPNVEETASSGNADIASSAHGRASSLVALGSEPIAFTAPACKSGNRSPGVELSEYTFQRAFLRAPLSLDSGANTQSQARCNLYRAIAVQISFGSDDLTLFEMFRRVAGANKWLGPRGIRLDDINAYLQEACPKLQLRRHYECTDVWVRQEGYDDIAMLRFNGSRYWKGIYRRKRVRMSLTDLKKLLSGGFVSMRIV